MTQPHIVLITADQLRADALGAYGGRAVPTPNIDRLAASADRYDSAYTVSPWCMPSRSSIVTGQYPHTHRAYSNFRDCRLSPERPTLYSLLREQGYATSHVGKCHYAPVPYGETRPDRTLPYDAFRDYYLSLGIDHLALQDDKQVSVWFADDYSQELEAAGHLEAYRAAVWNRDYAKVFPFPAPPEWHPDAWVGRKAAEFIGTWDASQPLFTWVSLSGPHFPFDAPDAYIDRVDAEPWGRRAWRRASSTTRAASTTPATTARRVSREPGRPMVAAPAPTTTPTGTSCGCGTTRTWRSSTTRSGRCSTRSSGDSATTCW